MKGGGGGGGGGSKCDVIKRGGSKCDVIKRGGEDYCDGSVTEGGGGGPKQPLFV